MLNVDENKLGKMSKNLARLWVKDMSTDNLKVLIKSYPNTDIGLIMQQEVNDRSSTKT